MKNKNNSFLSSGLPPVLSSDELNRFVRDWLDQNPQVFSGLKTTYATQRSQAKAIERHDASRESITKDEILRVVQKSILDEYNHPQIIEAVAEYLHQHFLMTH